MIKEILLKNSNELASVSGGLVMKEIDTYQNGTSATFEKEADSPRQVFLGIRDLMSDARGFGMPGRWMNDFGGDSRSLMANTTKMEFVFEFTLEDLNAFRQPRRSMPTRRFNSTRRAR